MIGNGLQHLSRAGRVLSSSSHFMHLPLCWQPATIQWMFMCSTGIRILLAMSMALWSPAWCCCALQAAAATILDETCEVQLAAGCCSRTPAAVRSCCEDEQTPCKCLERPNELNRLDTTTKLSVPKPGCETPAFVAFDASAQLPIQFAATIPITCCHTVHPPPQSLVVQHCLLLI